MEKRVLLLIFCFLLVLPLARARVVEYELTIEIEGGDVARWRASLSYDTPIERSSYFIISRIGEVQVTADSTQLTCEVRKEVIGTSILCKDLHTKEITYEFLAYDVLDMVGGIRRFTYSLPITTIVDRLEIVVKLPRGAEIVSKERLEKLGLVPITPENATITSDGKRIVVKWTFLSPPLGTDIDISIFYEELSDAMRLITVGVVLASIVAVFVLALSFREREKARQLMRILTPQERAIVELLSKSPRRQLDQKTIARRLDLSKSKTSRLIRSLAERGVVEVERRGRNNRIKLKL